MDLQKQFKTLVERFDTMKEVETLTGMKRSTIYAKLAGDRGVRLTDVLALEMALLKKETDTA